MNHRGPPSNLKSSLFGVLPASSSHQLLRPKASTMTQPQPLHKLLALLLLLVCAAAFVPPTPLSSSPSLQRHQGGAPGGARSWTVKVGMGADGGALKVSGEELEKELSEPGTPVVLDVYAQWCGPCQILAGELDKVAGLYGGKLRVLKVDSDEEPRIASALKVYGLPTIFFIKEGQLVHRVEGAMPASELTKLINQHCFGAEAA